MKTKSSTGLAPGSWTLGVEHWGPFSTRSLPPGALVIADERVLRLHPRLKTALRAHAVLPLKAGEGAKSLSTLGRLAEKTLGLSRTGTLVAIGGGTIGDLATVLAHLIKRGVRLIHVPTTLLAAVDSSLGGKGAVNVGVVKNALGVFHCPDETWLCPELFETLTETQRREGRLEGWKMALGDKALWERWSKGAPEDAALIRQSRQLKARICASDPYERTGARTVLNFGHTFGHVIESVSGHRVRHGEAVGLGMLCALDVGVALACTPAHIAEEVEAALPNSPGARVRLAQVLSKTGVDEVAQLLVSDKKGAEDGAVKMVLLEKPGVWHIQPVQQRIWARLFERWQRR